MTNPKTMVIAGPNGTGKTTFAIDITMESLHVFA